MRARLVTTGAPLAAWRSTGIGRFGLVAVIQLQVLDPAEGAGGLLFLLLLTRGGGRVEPVEGGLPRQFFRQFRVAGTARSSRNDCSSLSLSAAEPCLPVTACLIRLRRIRNGFPVRHRSGLAVLHQPVTAEDLSDLLLQGQPLFQFPGRNTVARRHRPHGGTSGVVNSPSASTWK